MPKISVIMPVFNGELFIGQAIDSLLSQTFQDWELIVVDDGSFDSTPSILEQYTDKRIRIIKQKNSGEARARNVGLNNARGKYIAFLDADDFYFPDALEYLSAFLDTHREFSVVYSNGEICDDNNNFVMYLDDLRPDIYSGKILGAIITSSSVITVPVCTMTRNSKIQEYSIKFDENLTIGPDWDFWIQLAAHVGIGYLPQVTCRYRIHNTNITKTAGSEKRRKDLAYIYMKIINSGWFNELPISTREQFYYNLLTKVISGDIKDQKRILEGEQLSNLPAYIQSNIWRIVGIDALQAGHSLEIVRECMLESNQLNPNDNKTRFLMRSLKIGNTFTLVWVMLWRWLLRTQSKLTSPSFSSTEHFQKMLGIQ